MPCYKPRPNPSQGFGIWRRAFLFLSTIIFVITSSSMGDALNSPESARVETSVSPAPRIDVRFVTRGFRVTHGRQIDTVVLHSSYNPRSSDRYSLSAILNIFRRERVAAHYLIDRDGQIYQLVREGDIANHAGISRWQGRTGVNRFSLGIELLNHPSDRYTEAQYRALNALLLDIRSRHRIRFLVAHREIAPGRRSDPWNFDWSRVADFRTR